MNIPNITTMSKGQRMVKIFAYFVQNKTEKFSVKDILSYLNLEDDVSLRNVQRDLKDLSTVDNCYVEKVVEHGRICYQINPEMRDELSLPI